MTNEEALACAWQMLIDANRRRNEMSIRDNNHWPYDEYPHLLHSLVFREAAKIVKQQLAARGERVYKYSAMDIRELAEAYLDADANRELLMIDMIMKIQREPSLLRLAESESKRRARERPNPPNPARAQKLLDKALKR